MGAATSKRKLDAGARFELAASGLMRAGARLVLLVLPRIVLFLEKGMVWTGDLISTPGFVLISSWIRC